MTGESKNAPIYILTVILKGVPESDIDMHSFSQLYVHGGAAYQNSRTPDSHRKYSRFLICHGLHKSVTCWTTKSDSLGKMSSACQARGLLDMQAVVPRSIMQLNLDGRAWSHITSIRTLNGITSIWEPRVINIVQYTSEMFT